MTYFKESTQKERKRLLDGGMTEFTRAEFEQILDDLGYEIDKTGGMTEGHTFDYINTGNEISYKAKSIRIRDKKTKRGFCHVDERRDADFEKLQKIRFGSFVFSNGRIWEL